jgi:hypothetical protein
MFLYTPQKKLHLTIVMMSSEKIIGQKNSSSRYFFGQKAYQNFGKSQNTSKN